jgi:hypothetical protein
MSKFIKGNIVLWKFGFLRFLEIEDVKGLNGEDYKEWSKKHKKSWKKLNDMNYMVIWNLKGRWIEKPSYKTWIQILKIIKM